MIKKILLVLLASILILITNKLSAQTTIKIDSNGNYIQTVTPAKPTGKYFFDKDGNKYPIYITAKSKVYVVRISKNTGKEYKQYLNTENTSNF